MNITFRTSERDPDTWTAEVLVVPGQDDLIVRGDHVFRVAKLIHRIGDRDIGARIVVVVDPLAIEPGAVLP